MTTLPVREPLRSSYASSRRAGASHHSHFLTLLGVPDPDCTLEPTDDGDMDMPVQVDTLPIDAYLTVNGLRLHYREWGDPAAPPLLILHGLTGHAWEFDRIASALSDRFRVLALDQRGHGASAWADDYSPELVADDIADFIDTLDLGSVHVLGHSMGGVNAWWFAARHPELVERLVLTDVTPFVITAPPIVGALRSALDDYAAAEYADPDDAVAEYLTGYDGAHAEELRIFVLNNLRQVSDDRWTWRFDAAGLRAWIDRAAASAAAHFEALRRIGSPTLVIRAGDSPFTEPDGAEEMATAIPDARLIEVPGSGHDIHIDQRDALLVQLRSFLRTR
jgi:esterase